MLDALKDAFHGLCAYCEGPVADGPWAIDTFRPRNRYETLARVYDNLYLCCRDCNTAKGGAFPVDAARSGMSTPHAPMGASEAALLIDPCAEDPRQHVDIDLSGQLVALSSRGGVTIALLKLNRPSLVRDRAQAMRRVEAGLDELDNFVPGHLSWERLMHASVPERLRVLGLDGGQPYLTARLAAAAAWADRAGGRPWLPDLSAHLGGRPQAVASHLGGGGGNLAPSSVQAVTPPMSTTTHPLAAGHPPRWACAWGHDNYGPYADLAVGRVKQRFRWCPPGSFQMGSPVDEEGRANDEGPQHEVTLSAGFWMADTPVTQDFYKALMKALLPAIGPGGAQGELVTIAEVNPSAHDGEGRGTAPVEEVSWDMAVAACARLVGLNPALADSSTRLRLPTEAEWEYACRAGSKGARYNDVLGAGVSLSDIIGPRRRPEGKGAGPERVKQRRANAWGLYDTLGCVLEWCLDEVEKDAPYPAEGLVDPVQVGGSLRASRGGAWDYPLSEVRAAVRVAEFADWTYDRNGFRLCIGAPPRPIPAVMADGRRVLVRARRPARGKFEPDVS